MKNRINKFFYNVLLLTIPMFLIEVIFKLASNQNIFDVATIRILFSLLCISIIVSYIELYLKDKKIKILNLTLVGIASIYSFLQIGFNNFIGVYISFNVTSQAGAVFSYIIEFLKSFYWYYYLILLPFVLMYIYYKLQDLNILKIKMIDILSDN